MQFTKILQGCDMSNLALLILLAVAVVAVVLSNLKTKDVAPIEENDKIW
jgi:hypothetical protein